MTNKTITAECDNCESTYEVQYAEELTSEEYPEFCPFCGEMIEDITEQEEYDEDDDDWQEEWK
jgi:hypothetical protein